MRYCCPALALLLVPALAHACDMMPEPSVPSGPTSALQPSSQPAPGASYPVADFATLAQETVIPDAVRVATRSFPTAMAHIPGASPMIQGLQELARTDPGVHAYDVELLPGKDWYRSHGGVGHYSVGAATRPDQVIDGFSKRVENEHLGDTTKALYLDFDPRAIPDGTHTELAYKQFTATMDINVSRAQLKGVFTEILQAPRIITTGNASFYAGEVPYPIELPNVAVDSLRATVQVPAGGAAEDDDGPELSVRDPRMVFTKYQEAVASLATDHPTVAMIYATVPVTASANYQRNYFNQAMRAWCYQHQVPLLDVASLLSHDQAGQPTRDQQGERLAPDLTDPQSHGPNAIARERLARAWWLMMARLQGWKPPV